MLIITCMRVWVRTMYYVTLTDHLRHCKQNILFYRLCYS
jgi:hypothetical protein